MSAEHEHAVKKLPKWAQQIIDRQQRQINALTRELQQLGCQMETEMSFESYGLDDQGGLPARVYLPGGRATVHLGTDRYGRRHDIHFSVEKNLEGVRALRVNGAVGPITVEPQASNVVTITSLRPNHLKQG